MRKPQLSTDEQTLRAGLRSIIDYLISIGATNKEVGFATCRFCIEATRCANDKRSIKQMTKFKRAGYQLERAEHNWKIFIALLMRVQQLEQREQRNVLH
jgi:hypothetical protein